MGGQAADAGGRAVLPRGAGGVLIAHPHANANVREAARAFADAGMLHSFWTGVAWNPDWALGRLLPDRWCRQLERRAFDASIRGYVRLHPWREAARLAAQTLGWRALMEAAALSPNASHESLDRRIARLLEGPAGAAIHTIYCYDHGARDAFRVAARTGRRRVYDLPIGYWRAHVAIVREELERWPAWRELAPDLGTLPAEFARKDDEIALADTIVVPSRFVARTLATYLPSLPPVVVVPFGAPTAQPLDDAELEPRRAEPLRTLFVGGLDLRKGVPDLFAALRFLNGRTDTTIVGRARAPCGPLLAALGSCRWHESLPRSEVLAAMRAADVFIFPTLFEGMALVVLEAMSQGCVVVTTANSGAEDLIEHGVNGFIVPVRSPEAIARVVAELDEDRDRLRAMRQAAQARVAAQTWASYRARIREATAGAATLPVA
jgi:glycosyltransferase involved in cell wall biosynthesis